MLWICNSCTAAYSPGAPRCPQCGSTDYLEQGEEMAKITVHGGPSNAAAGPVITGGEWSSGTVDGTPVVDGYDPNNLTLPDGPGDPYTLGSDGTRYFEPKTLEDGGESVTASVAVTPPGETTDDAIAADVEETEPVDYDACTVEQLKEFLTERSLPVSGKKPELIARLVEDDEAEAAKAADES